ncbi:MAG: hypothetical protein R3B06_15910 [Kofleriaceae bacterium]
MNRLVLAALVCAGLVSPVAAEGTVVVQGEVRVSAQAGPQPRRYRRAPGPRLMAPLRIDIGGIGAGSAFGFLSGAEVSAGIHWASLSPEPTNFDIGLGLFGGAMTNATVADTTDGVQYGGVYGEFGKTLSGGDYWRTWASGRGEYLSADAFGVNRVGLGISGKLEAEVYLSGVGVSPEGIFLGTYAIGVYVEAALRRLSADVNIGQVGVGLTIRTPMVWRW